MNKPAVLGIEGVLGSSLSFDLRWFLDVRPDE
jgi:hypothetical protein